MAPVPRRGDEHHFLTLAAAGTDPLRVQSVFLWGSQLGITCPFSWCIPQWLQPSLDWGKWHKVSYDHPNQTATSCTGAEPGPEPAQPFLGKWCRWWFIGLGKETQCQHLWRWDWNGSWSLLQELLVNFSQKLSRSRRAWFPLGSQRRSSGKGSIAQDTTAMWWSGRSCSELVWSCHLRNHICVMLDWGLEDLLHLSEALCWDFQQIILYFKATMLSLL